MKCTFEPVFNLLLCIAVSNEFGFESCLHLKEQKIKNTLIAQIPLCPFDIPLKHVQRWIKNMEKQGKTRATATQQTRQFAIQTLISLQHSRIFTTLG